LTLTKKDILKKFFEIRDNAYRECMEYYPKHIKTIRVLYNIFLDLMAGHRKYDRKKFHDYLWNFSDYIAKKYFPDDINERWRRPMVLEQEIYEHVFWKYKNIWNERQRAKFDEQFIEMAGLPSKVFGEDFWSEEQVSRAYGISVEELRKITERHKGKFKGHILNIRKRRKGYTTILDAEDLELYKGD